MSKVLLLLTTDPGQPKLMGTLGNLVFENEAMSYGERTVDGKLQRFLLVGNDLYNATVDPQSGPSRGRIGGGEVLVVDVTDPKRPRLRSRTPGARTLPGAVTTSTHTVQCLTVSCEFAYTAGDSGKFSIVDLRDLDQPRQIATVASPAAGPNPIFTRGAGHYWDVDGAGIAWHTGSGGATAFDISDPLSPRRLSSTDENGTRGRGTTSSSTTPSARTPRRSRRVPPRPPRTAASCWSPRRTTSTTARSWPATAPAPSRPGMCRTSTPARRRSLRWT